MARCRTEGEAIRRAARRDNVEHWLVDALRKCGAAVVFLNEPTDLLVGFRGANYLLEVKSPGGKLTEKQVKFIATWPGQVAVVETLDDAWVAILGKETMK